MAEVELTPEDKIYFQRGRKILIPAGAEISNMHPQRRGKSINKRARWVTVHSINDGMSQAVYFWLRSESCRDQFRADHPGVECESAFAAYDALEARREASIDPDEKQALLEESKAIRVWIAKPSVSWAGSGGYWCDCPVEDIRAQPASADSGSGH